MPGAWEVRGVRHGLRATNEWGADRRPATDLAQAVMEQRRVEVWDEYEDPDGRKSRVLNPADTTAAQENAETRQGRFGRWVWEDPDRAHQLAERKQWNGGWRQRAVELSGVRCPTGCS